jgi:uncharacterized OB-fold protein
MNESIIKRHYDALKTGKLRAHKCKSCSHVTFPMTMDRIPYELQRGSVDIDLT